MTYVVVLLIVVGVYLIYRFNRSEVSDIGAMDAYPCSGCQGKNYRAEMNHSYTLVNDSGMVHGFSLEDIKKTCADLKVTFRKDFILCDACRRQVNDFGAKINK